MVKPYTLHKFFTVSNAIEGIYDNKETLRNVEFFENTYYLGLEQMMYLFHSKLEHLNSYCTPGKLRNYPVYVAGREGMKHEHIQRELSALFLKDPKTYSEIKQWHIDFEHIHPFGDGNGRTGRILMLRQLLKHNITIPYKFLTMKNFEANRQQYYRWF